MADPEQQLLAELSFFTDAKTPQPELPAPSDLDNDSDASLGERKMDHMLVSKDDQRTASELKFLGLGKVGSKTAYKETTHEILSDSSSNSSPAATTGQSADRSPKRKTSDILIVAERPKRPFHGRGKEHSIPNPVASKPAAGQLNRPTKNPLTSKKSQTFTRNAISDKFAFQDDTAQGAVSTEPHNSTRTRKQTKPTGPNKGPIERNGVEQGRRKLERNVKEQVRRKPGLVDEGAKRKRGRPRKTETATVAVRKPKAEKASTKEVEDSMNPSYRRSARHRGSEPIEKSIEDEVAMSKVATVDNGETSRSAALRIEALERTNEQQGLFVEDAESEDVASIKSRGSAQISRSASRLQPDHVDLMSSSPQRPRIGVSCNVTDTSKKQRASPSDYVARPRRRRNEQERLSQGRMPALSPKALSKNVQGSQGGGSEGDFENGDGNARLTGEEAEQSEENRSDPEYHAEPPEEVPPLNENTAEEIGGSSEDDASSEEEDIPDADEDGDQGEVIELFDGERLWQNVLEGARTVGASTVKGKESLRRPKLVTDTIKGFVELVKDMKMLYEGIGSENLAKPDLEADEQRLAAVTEDVGDFVDELSEARTSEHERSLLIQDIYAHAIPAMVFMLKAALSCRSRRYSRPEDNERLDEVIRIQATIIQLCEKARRWKAIPVTKRPIKRAVANNILPPMRDLKERYFGREAVRRHTRTSREAQQRASEEAHMKRQERLEQEKREVQKQIQDNLRQFQLAQRPRTTRKQARQNTNHRIVRERQRPGTIDLELGDTGSLDLRTHQDRQAEERPRAVDQQPLQSVYPVRPHQRSHATTGDHWTKEQNTALVEQLQNPATRSLPGKFILDLLVR